MMNPEQQILTNSSLTTFRTCPRKFQFRYQQGYVPAEEKEALFFGKLFHAGLETWGRAGNDIAPAIETVNKIIAESVDQNHFLKVTAIALLEGYDRRYQNDEYEIIEVEKEFRAPLLNPDTAGTSKLFVLKGVIDAIVRHKTTGRLYIKETKTTSEDISPDSDYWQRLLMDAQVSGYYIGAEASGLKIESCVYDVIKKPTLKPYKATPQESRKYKADGTLYASQRDVDETPEEYYTRISGDITASPDKYFARREVPRSENDLVEYYFDVWNTGQQLRACQLKDKFPRYVHSCMSIYGPCQFWKACSGQASIEDPNHYKRVENVHQELTQGTKTEVK